MLNASLYNLLQNTEYCICEIENVRHEFNNLKKENFENLTKGVALMYVYAPAELKTQVLSLLNELHTRYQYILNKE